MSTEKLTLTAAHGATIADMRDVEAHLNKRLEFNDEYRALPAADPSRVRFKLAGDSASGFTLEITGSGEAIENAIGRWCTCCSTYEQTQQTEYLREGDHRALFSDDGRTLTSTISWYEPVRGSAKRHITDQTAIKLGPRAIRFAITDHRML
ncbi:hypothetical protein [Mycolicibacter sinensis]|uniref:Uncharacterized protein n=1 Tax=Mycolicibacter sinensis (strain JDM601) TaxID=875328 RepID=A0A1A2XW11_MYCSD|nr:hypothetical protein [Mycolicibacter sinensis]OBI29066.1 hypothetical protein A5710_22720 [Mycolicibacter sinensis]